MEIIMAAGIIFLVSGIASSILAGLGLVSFGLCFWIIVAILYVIIIIAGGDVGI